MINDQVPSKTGKDDTMTNNQSSNKTEKDDKSNRLMLLSFLAGIIFLVSIKSKDESASQDIIIKDPADRKRILLELLQSDSVFTESRSLYKQCLMGFSMQNIHDINQILYFTLFPAMIRFFSEFSSMIELAQERNIILTWDDIHRFTSHYWILRSNEYHSKWTGKDHAYKGSTAQVFESTNKQQFNEHIATLNGLPPQIARRLVMDTLPSHRIPEPPKKGNASFDYLCYFGVPYGIYPSYDSFDRLIVLHNHNNATDASSLCNVYSALKDNELDASFIRTMNLVGSNYDESLIDSYLFSKTQSKEILNIEVIENYFTVREGKYDGVPYTRESLVQSISNKFPILGNIPVFNELVSWIQDYHSIYQTSDLSKAGYGFSCYSREDISDDSIYYYYKMHFSSPITSFIGDSVPNSDWRTMVDAIDQNKYLPAVISSIVLNKVKTFIESSLASSGSSKPIDIYFNNLRDSFTNIEVDLSKYFPIPVTREKYYGIPDWI